MTPARREPRVVVLGGGSWGTTVASIASRRAETLQWVRSPETAEDINERHRNLRYLGDEVELSPTLKATTDFEKAADSADVVVMAVPSHSFRDVLKELQAYLRPRVPIVSLIKGLEQGTSLRMSQIVAEVMPGHPAGILAGPNIAREVAQGYAAAAVMAMPDQQLSTRLAQMFRTQRFRVYTTDDVLGVEMAGALKNVYAIATGMGYSLGIGENTRALVIARALREMTKLGVAMGGEPETFPGLAGLGDSDRDVHEPAQQEPSRRRADRGGQADRGDPRVDGPGGRGRQGRQRDHGVGRPLRRAHADRAGGGRRHQPRPHGRGRLSRSGGGNPRATRFTAQGSGRAEIAFHVAT